MTDPILTALHARNEPTQADLLPGQIPNHDGFAVWDAGPWTSFDRFLILGSTGGSFYATERQLTTDQMAIVDTVMDIDPVRAVNRIVEISDGGLPPRNTQAIYALAVAMSGNPAARQAASSVYLKVCRTGTDRFTFTRYIKALHRRGWGRGLKNTVARGFTDLDVHTLALHAIKYQAREGWTNLDLMRLSHPKAPTVIDHASDDAWIEREARKAVFDFMAGRQPDLTVVPALIVGHLMINQPDVTPERAAEIITQYRLPWESVPSQLRTSPKVWEALLPTLGLTALIRNLPTITRAGLLGPNSDHQTYVTDRLTNADAIQKARVHPIAFLNAHMIYGSGGSEGRSQAGPYTPNQAVLHALDRGFHLAFKAVQPTGKRLLAGLDVSGSMSSGRCAGSWLTPRQGCAAMALVTVSVEPMVHTMAFSSGFRPFNITPNEPLSAVMRRMSNMPFDWTDCSVPMTYATKNRIPVDAFVVYTDSETNQGHSFQAPVALQKYRDAMGIDARLIVVGMVGNNFTIADPNDPGMLDVVGFSADTPAVISNFAAGLF